MGMSDGVKLIDIRERYRATGGRFTMPTPEQARERLRFGRHAKLIFESQSGTERMWVRVIEHLPDGRFVGILANSPVDVPMAFGDRVEFGPEHVADLD